MILTLAAVLSLAAGIAAMSPSAQASQTQLFPPAQNGNGKSSAILGYEGGRHFHRPFSFSALSSNSALGPFARGAFRPFAA
jgi:hypothetical protein